MNRALRFWVYGPGEVRSMFQALREGWPGLLLMLFFLFLAFTLEGR
jgi:hypothetical protein